MYISIPGTIFAWGMGSSQQIGSEQLRRGLMDALRAEGETIGGSVSNCTRVLILEIEGLHNHELGLTK